MSNDTWCTPSDLFDALHNEFEFNFDLCADIDNAMCTMWSDDIVSHIGDIFLGKNGTACLYNNYWVNPPYSRGNIDICMGAVKELNDIGKTIVSLTRFDPSAEWFKKSVDGIAAEVRMLDKRVKFVGADGSYPFPCCISIYRGYIPQHTHYYSWGWE